MPTTPPTITALPLPPDPNDRATFNTRAYPWSVAQQTLATEVGAVADNVYDNAVEAEAAALAATGSATSAGTSATTATTQATTATTQAGLASASATTATTQADLASASATTATTQAGLASASATQAAASAASASAIVLGVASGYPALRPSLLLDFANSRAVDPRITFTRSSTATRVNQFGLIESVASGVPRIDHDPVTGECRGLLIEEARTNLLTYSEQFDNAAWMKIRSSLTANAVTAPDGALTADKLIEDTTASSSHYFYTILAKAASSIQYAAAIYVKAAERSKILFGIYGGTSGRATAIFDVSAGSYASLTTTSGWSAATAEIQSVGNGWYRCIVVATSNTDARVDFQATLVNGAGADVYTGDGTSGIYVWGAQLE